MFEHETLYSKEKVLGLDVADIKAKVSKTLVAETVMKSVPLKEEVTNLIPGLLIGSKENLRLFALENIASIHPGVNHDKLLNKVHDNIKNGKGKVIK